MESLLRYVFPLSDDKHRFVRDSSKSTLEIQDKNSVQDKTENFFPDKIFSLIKNFFKEKFSPNKKKKILWKNKFLLEKKLSEKEILKFCLGLHAAVVFP